MDRSRREGESGWRNRDLAGHHRVPGLRLVPGGVSSPGQGDGHRVGGGGVDRWPAGTGCRGRPGNIAPDGRPFHHLQRASRRNLAARDGNGRRAEAGLARPVDPHGIATWARRVRRGDDRSGVVGRVLLHTLVAGDDGECGRRALAGHAWFGDHVGAGARRHVSGVSIGRWTSRPVDAHASRPGAGASGAGGDAGPPPPRPSLRGAASLLDHQRPAWAWGGTSSVPPTTRSPSSPPRPPCGGFRRAGFVAGGVASIIVVHRRMKSLGGDAVGREYGMLLLMVTLTLAVMTVTALG